MEKLCGEVKQMEINCSEKKLEQEEELRSKKGPQRMERLASILRELNSIHKILS